MTRSAGQEHHERRAVLTLSTIGFTLMFAVWLMFGVLGVPIRQEFGLTDVQLSWLSAVAVLNGSIWRLATGIMADRYGGKVVFVTMLLVTAIPSFLVAYATTYKVLLLYAFLVGFAGNAFSVGIAWNSAFYPRNRQGFALGMFGAGNLGAAATKFIGPALITMTPAFGYLGGVIPGGWRFVPFLYGSMLLAMAVAMWAFSPRNDRKPAQGKSLVEMLAPLKHVRVWRFSLYYLVVFGAYVALAAWLPKYYVDVFGLPLYQAALLTAIFIFPASLLRPPGGMICDKVGARRVMYWAFGSLLLATAALSIPDGHVVIHLPTRYEFDGMREVLHYRLTPWPFTGLVFVVGVAMGVGKAAVYKYIPEYFPKDVGAVGGLVGMLGALGGFFLLPVFALAQAATGLPQTTFMILFLLTAASAVWLHLTVLSLLRKAAPRLEQKFEHRGEGDHR